MLHDAGALLRVCIVDDEDGIRRNLKHQFEILQLPVQVIGEANCVQQGIQLLRQLQPDVAFLDVEMPDGQGFDILRHVKDIRTKVIFITAFNQYAVEAFRFSALDYLLKPIDSEELEEAIHKAKSLKEQETYSFRLGVLLNNNDTAATQARRLVLKNAESIFAFPIADIVRLQASNNYTTFYIREHPPVVVSKTLKDYEEMLLGHGFFRIHQSHLLNVRFFSRYDKKDNVVELHDKTLLPLSSKKRDEFFAFLGAM